MEDLSANPPIPAKNSTIALQRVQGA